MGGGKPWAPGVIVEGTVRLSIGSVSGREATLRFLKRGSIVGLSSLSRPDSYRPCYHLHLRASEESVLGLFDPAIFAKFGSKPLRLRDAYRARPCGVCGHACRCLGAVCIHDGSAEGRGPSSGGSDCVGSIRRSTCCLYHPAASCGLGRLCERGRGTSPARSSPGGNSSSKLACPGIDIGRGAPEPSRIPNMSCPSTIRAIHDRVSPSTVARLAAAPVVIESSDRAVTNGRT
jgi:hypothetical protein